MHERDRSDAARARALERFSLLRPYLEDGVPLARIAREQRVPLRTAQRWVQRYQQQGLAGLTRKPRADRGSRRQVPTELRQLIEGLALQRPRPSVATIQRRVAEVARRQGWQVPSYDQVSAITQALDPALITLAHAGPRVYRETFDLLYRREASQPNEIWQADHTPLDLWLAAADGPPIRPWLTIILDDYSRAVAGYLLSVQAPSALQTALALRHAIWRKADPRWHVCGVPRTFYTDHGSDFTSRHLEQVAANLKMALVFSWPGQPRGRGKIERFFASVNQLFLCRVPGYAPAGSAAITPRLTLPEFEAHWQEWLLSEYQQRLHGETRVAPQARWEAGGFLPHLPETVEQLDLLLLTVATIRRVQQDGIRFQGFRYIDVILAAYVGEEVTIRYDPRDMAEIRVYHREAFLCRAVCQEIAGETVSLKEILQARNARRRELRTALTTRRTVVERFLAMHQPAPLPAPPPVPPATAPLKRYYND